MIAYKNNYEITQLVSFAGSSMWERSFSIISSSSILKKYYFVIEKLFQLAPRQKAVEKFFSWNQTWTPETKKDVLRMFVLDIFSMTG